MIELGKKQELTVAKLVDFGVYLGETENAGEKETVLLPKKQVPEETQKGDKISVFIYKDSSDRLIATVRAENYFGRNCSAPRSTGNKNRSIFRLGLGKRPFPSI